jgi:hypothetical protein
VTRLDDLRNAAHELRLRRDNLLLFAKRFQQLAADRERSARAITNQLANIDEQIARLSRAHDTPEQHAP